MFHVPQAPTVKAAAAAVAAPTITKQASVEAGMLCHLVIILYGMQYERSEQRTRHNLFMYDIPFTKERIRSLL